MARRPGIAARRHAISLAGSTTYARSERNPAAQESKRTQRSERTRQRERTRRSEGTQRSGHPNEPGGAKEPSGAAIGTNPAERMNPAGATMHAKRTDLPAAGSKRTQWNNDLMRASKRTGRSHIQAQPPVGEFKRSMRGKSKRTQRRGSPNEPNGRGSPNEPSGVGVRTNPAGVGIQTNPAGWRSERCASPCLPAAGSG